MFPATSATAWPGAHGWLRVSLIAGLAAATTTVVFNLLVAEPLIDRAVRFEEASGRGGAGRNVALLEPFTRSEQHGGMVLGVLLLALGAALLLAGSALLIGPHAASPRRLWVAVIGAAAWAVALVPAVKYPPLPPGAGSKLPIGERQAAYLLLIAAGMAGAGAAASVLRSLRAQHTRTLQLAAAFVALIVPPALAVALLPENKVAHALPSGLVAEFRAASLGSQLVFWLAFAVVGAWQFRHRRPPGA